MTISIVTDLAYGDSGKGTTVDFLSRRGSTLVVRHSGASQCGHNVITADGRHHEFSQFGAGTFAGAKTFLSKFMLVNPQEMIREGDHLRELGELDVWERMYVDRDAIVITPWHVAANRMQAAARGASCGMGVGVAQKQNIDRPDLTVQVRDLFDPAPALSRRLDDLRRYLHMLALAEKPSDVPSRSWAAMLVDEDLADDLARQYRAWVNLGPQVVQGSELLGLSRDHDHTVFEGAQGVLLDEWYGFHPYTTWSTTTHENALTLLNEMGCECAPTRYGVVRAYMTRHGAGPFPTQSDDLRFAEPHNLTGLWQGAFRQGHLDVSALRYAVDVCRGVDQLVVTHTDRASSWRYSDSYSLEAAPRDSRDLGYQASLTNKMMSVQPELVEVNTAGLLGVLADTIAPIGLVSYGPSADDKKWLPTVVRR